MQQTFILQRGARAAARIGARSGASQSAQRTWAAGAAARPKKRRRRYRYAFNGMEKDDEIKGEWTTDQNGDPLLIKQGTSYTTHFRQYDPRLGKWLSVDPKMDLYPESSPYSAYGNSPIFIVDPAGDVLEYANGSSEAAFAVQYFFSSPATRTKLDMLNASEVTYYIVAPYEPCKSLRING